MKKYTYSYIILLLLFSFVLKAKELPVQVETSVPKLIQQIKSSKVKNRRILINQLKIQLRKMNKKSRHNIMLELKKAFSKKEKQKQKQQHNLHSKSKNSDKKKCIHQPKYRHLRHQRRQNNGQGSGNRNGHK